MPLQYLQEATALARQHGLATHLDGARLFNAAVATPEAGADPYLATRHIASYFDSVSICLSKGLGAPIGSVLCGSRDFIAQALRWRKVAGGGMRQVGMLAAAAIYALEHNVPRLAHDHAMAARLAAGLANIEGITLRSAQTNIVFVDVANGRGADLLAHLEKHNVLATGLLGLRFVTHLHINEADIDYTVAAVRTFFA